MFVLYPVVFDEIHVVLFVISGVVSKCGLDVFLFFMAFSFTNCKHSLQKYTLNY